jgi:hypothetical protein
MMPPIAYHYQSQRGLAGSFSQNGNHRTQLGFLVHHDHAELLEKENQIECPRAKSARPRIEKACLGQS